MCFYYLLHNILESFVKLGSNINVIEVQKYRSSDGGRAQRKVAYYNFFRSCLVSKATIRFLELKFLVETAGTDTEAVLNKLSKQELVQLVFNTEANMGFKISATGIKDRN